MTNKTFWIAAALLVARPDPDLTQTGPPPTDIYLVEVPRLCCWNIRTNP